MKFIKTVFNGILEENPTFRLLLGMCPTLAVTTSMMNGIGMGLTTMLVLICSNVLISLLRNVIPDKIRIPCFVVIIAAFVTMVGMLLEAYLPSLYASLGLFIPLIVVNCIILGRAEAFASKNPVLLSAADGLGMGLGFTISLGTLGAIREILGAGSILGYSLFSASFEPALIMILPPGAFLTLGLLMGILNKLQEKNKERK